jgi:catechol 2,3-dioxygenase-like lactoylglutathione lyase family enzyme
MTGIARFGVTALDSPDPQALAAFYSRLTGWEIERDDGDWVHLRNPGGGPTLACQLAEDHKPPEWPGGDRPQQLHLDFYVPDLDEGERQVLAIGARKAGEQPGGEDWRVYLDPAGHPFCLCIDRD